MNEIEFLGRLFRGAERRAPGSEEISRRIATLCGLGLGSKVLDLGSGAGPTARLLAKEYGCEVTCVDLDASALESLAEAARRDGVGERIHPIQADAREVELPEGSFQCVLCEGSVRFLGQSFEEAVGRFRRLLGTDGRLVVTTEARVGRTLPTAVASFFQERGQQLLFPRELTVACERSGFEPLTVEAFPETVVEGHYKAVELALASLSADAASAEAGALEREIDLFRRDGGRTAVNTVLLVARRREPGEKPRAARGGA